MKQAENTFSISTSRNREKRNQVSCQIILADFGSIKITEHVDYVSCADIFGNGVAVKLASQINVQPISVFNALLQTSGHIFARRFAV